MEVSRNKKTKLQREDCIIKIWGNILRRQINAGNCDTNRNQFQQLRRETLLRAFISPQFYITVVEERLGRLFYSAISGNFLI